MVKNVEREEFIAEMYSMVLEYHYEATKFSGFAGGSSESVPLIVRQSSVSLLRPLTGLEAVCSGISPDIAGLNLSTDSEKLLTGNK